MQSMIESEPSESSMSTTLPAIVELLGLRFALFPPRTECFPLPVLLSPPRLLDGPLVRDAVTPPRTGTPTNNMGRYEYRSAAWNGRTGMYDGSSRWVGWFEQLKGTDGQVRNCKVTWLPRARTLTSQTMWAETKPRVGSKRSR